MYAIRIEYSTNDATASTARKPTAAQTFFLKAIAVTSRVWRSRASIANVVAREPSFCDEPLPVERSTGLDGYGLILHPGLQHRGEFGSVLVPVCLYCVFLC